MHLGRLPCPILLLPCTFLSCGCSYLLPSRCLPAATTDRSDGPFIDGGVKCRIGLDLWRQQRYGSSDAGAAAPAIVHLIGRSSPFSGNDSTAGLGGWVGRVGGLLVGLLVGQMGTLIRERFAPAGRCLSGCLCAVAWRLRPAGMT